MHVTIYDKSRRHWYDSFSPKNLNPNKPPALPAQTQEVPQLFGPLGPINPVEMLANTDTSYFKNKVNSCKLPDGQTEFHIPKEMVCCEAI